jgi:hypothetical protein
MRNAASHRLDRWKRVRVPVNCTSGHTASDGIHDIHQMNDRSGLFRVSANGAAHSRSGDAYHAVNVETTRRSWWIIGRSLASR